MFSAFGVEHGETISKSRTKVAARVERAVRRSPQILDDPDSEQFRFISDTRRRVNTGRKMKTESGRASVRDAFPLPRDLYKPNYFHHPREYGAVKTPRQISVERATNSRRRAQYKDGILRPAAMKEFAAIGWRNLGRSGSAWAAKAKRKQSGINW